jgi:hypothetical protein
MLNNVLQLLKQENADRHSHIFQLAPFENNSDDNPGYVIL